MEMINLKNLIDIKNIIYFFLLSIIFSLVNIGFQYMNQKLFNIIYLQSNEVWKSLKLVILLGVFLLIAFGLSMYFKDYYNNMILKNANIKLKNRLFNKIFNLNIYEFSKRKNNNFISLINNDIELFVNSYFQARNNIGYSVIQLILAVIFLFYISSVLAVVVIIASIIPMLVPKLFAEKIDQQTIEMSDNFEKYTNTIKENIIGVETIKTFGIVDKIVSNFDVQVENLEESDLNCGKTNYIAHGITISTSYFSFFIILIVGLILMAKEKLILGTVIAASNMSNLVRNPIVSISNNLNLINSVKSIETKIKDLLSIDCQVENAVEYHEFKDTLKVKKLSFKYEEEYILSNINLEFKKGKKYLLIGKSGCGKSTLLRLLLGYYTDFEGCIQLDGYDVRSLSEDSIGSIYSYVHQDTFILNDSIMNNITLFKSYKNEELNNAISISRVDEIIDKKEDGIQTVISESGFSISGGEAQRIQIARAIIFPRPIMLLDEATSGLDNSMAIEIENRLLDFKDMTLINISHKINSKELSRYDEIIYIKNGKVEVNGSYEQIKDNIYFKQLLSINEENDYEVNN